MRELKINNNFIPSKIEQGDELFRNGIFVFNITRMTDYIKEHNDKFLLDCIKVLDYRSDSLSVINESHVNSVDISIHVIIAEICPGIYNVIDGHHRIEKAYRDKVDTIMAYKLTPEQFIPFLTTKEGYKSFIEYWNGKLKRGRF